MSTSSVLGGTSAPLQVDTKDIDLLGPSDSSDSGNDVQGRARCPPRPTTLANGSDTEATGPASALRSAKGSDSRTTAAEQATHLEERSAS
jgi:hypothetical protein